MRRQDQQSRVFYELSALVLNILRSPPTPIQFSDEPQPRPPVTSSSRRPPPPPPALPQITPAGFASLLLGISLALMLCGSVTFFIGFLLMPWVLGLVMIFYVVGIVSSLSMLGRAILCHTTSPSSPRKGVPAWKLLWRCEGEMVWFAKDDLVVWMWQVILLLAMYKENGIYHPSFLSIISAGTPEKVIEILRKHVDMVVFISRLGNMFSVFS